MSQRRHHAAKPLMRLLRLLRLLRLMPMLALMLSGNAAWTATDTVLAVRAPADTQLQWRGLNGPDLSGSTAQIMYPAPGIAGLLVAVATHAALVETSRERGRSQQQLAADRVLEPHREALAAWTPQALFDAALAKLGRTDAQLLPVNVDAAPGQWVVELTPQFAMAQDQRSLVLDSAVRIVRAGSAAGSKFETAVRVVSTPLRIDGAGTAVPVALASASGATVASSASSASGGGDMAVPLQAIAEPASWSAQGGRALKDETAAMLAHAIAIALAQAQAKAQTQTQSAPSADPAPFRTHRYLMGDQEQMERSQLLAQGCGRIVLRTLRGTLLSGPVRPVAGPGSCAAPYGLGL